MSERLSSFLAENKGILQSVPFCCSLRTQGYAVNLFTDFDQLYSKLSSEDDGFSKVIPGWKVGREMGLSKYSIYLLAHNEQTLVFDNNTTTAYIAGRTDDFIDGQAVAWISYWMMEAQKQKESHFTMHSSAITIEGRGILLLGHSGAGKTSIMLDLCRKYQGEIVSNDLTVIGYNNLSENLTLVDGTKEVRLRRTSVEKDFPELVHLFPERSRSSWETKAVLLPEEMGLVSAVGPKQLFSIFEVHLDSKGKDELLSQNERGVAVRYRLYEDMSRIIRGSAISVFDASGRFFGYMPSLDTEDLHTNRVACIDQMVDSVGITSVSGGRLNDISETIYKKTFEK